MPARSRQPPRPDCRPHRPPARSTPGSPSLALASHPANWSACVGRRADRSVHGRLGRFRQRHLQRAPLGERATPGQSSRRQGHERAEPWFRDHAISVALADRRRHRPEDHGHYARIRGRRSDHPPVPDRARQLSYSRKEHRCLQHRHRLGHLTWSRAVRSGISRSRRPATSADSHPPHSPASSARPSSPPPHQPLPQLHPQPPPAPPAPPEPTATDEPAATARQPSTPRQCGFARACRHSHRLI